MLHTELQFLGLYISIKIEWDLTNGPLSKLLELLDTQVEGSVQWVLLEISWNIVQSLAVGNKGSSRLSSCVSSRAMALLCQTAGALSIGFGYEILSCKGGMVRESEPWISYGYRMDIMDIHWVQGRNVLDWTFGLPSLKQHGMVLLQH